MSQLPLDQVHRNEFPNQISRMGMTKTVSVYPFFDPGFRSEYEVITDLGKACKKIPRTPVGPHFLYHLGPAIRPPNPVKNGKIYPSGRVWCALDTLLTSATVSEARDITSARLEAE